MSDYNVSVANMLRTLADYVQMAEGNAKVKIGVQFKLKNMDVVRIPVMPVDRFSAALGAWASSELISKVRQYQNVTGTTEGDELIAHFQQAQDYLNSALDKTR